MILNSEKKKIKAEEEFTQNTVTLLTFIVGEIKHIIYWKTRCT